MTDIWGQRKIIGVSDCDNWERLEEINGKACLLSADGNFVMFKTHSGSGRGTTILKDLKLGAEKEFALTFNERSFDSDRMFSFQISADSLVVFDTKKGSYLYVSGVNNYFTIESETTGMVVYFTEQMGTRALTIWDVKKGRKLGFLNVYSDRHWFNTLATGLLIGSTKGLVYADLKGFKSIMVTSDTSIENAALSYSGNEIAYISHGENGSQLNYFNTRSGTGSVLLSDSSDYLKDSWKLETSDLSFGNDDGNVFFSISRVNKYYRDQPDSVITQDVNVWSYQDLHLQAKQLSVLSQQSSFATMINVQSRKIVQIESEELSLELTGNTNKNFVLTTRINENEFYWNKQKKSMFLFSATTGNKILLAESQHPGFRFIAISQDNKFVIWFDGADGNYYSYNITNGKISNISRLVNVSLRFSKQRHQDAGIIHNANPYEGQYWTNNNSSLIVYSKNDIWQLDPLALKAPINLTNGYGDAHSIRFRFVEDGVDPVGFYGKELLVWAFDNRSKQNGFWKINIEKSLDPVKLVMSDNAYFFNPVSTIVSLNSAEDPTMFKPIKASKRNVFIVRRMSSAKAPNLYYTVNFRGFKQLTNINPNKGYAWISTKLIKWRLPDGRQAEGILHRPDNFDSTKKYPIIFNYYEQRSECLNVFRTPELSGHNINIPWYVSRGYLVFEPDFYYKRGKTAESVIGSVESALVELRELPYVDQNKMGIQGQSHGGYETNILATGTSYFAAACEMAGFTNIISEYGSIRPSGLNNQSAADVGQRNLGVFPWDHPEVFIENSPVFHISKMSTPLLMVHNKEDDAVPFSHAIELYLGMRRLGKKVWLLQYDREGHQLLESNNKLDFTIRMQQFFDHYLKGAPMPVWMSKGIPASLKGVVSGLKFEAPTIGMNK
jgi:dienelactone hydrolase